MNFKQFTNIIQKQVQRLLKEEVLYITSADKHLLYDRYLNSWPAGTNNIYITRRENDCNTCKQFIRTFGRVVAIAPDNSLISVWDVEGLEEPYATVAKALSEYVKASPVVNRFMYLDSKIGAENNIVQKGDRIHRWHHFHVDLSDRFVVNRNQSVGDAIADLRDSKNVLVRGLGELTIEAAETVLDLISQNSLYRGLEFKPALSAFLNLQKQFQELPEEQHNNYCWATAAKVNPSIARIRNSSIGTLLIDISDGLDLDEAVRKYESVVAPINYKRPKAIYSARMLEQAQQKVMELGLIESLPRRFATVK